MEVDIIINHDIDIGSKVQKLRTEKKITVRKLSELTGITGSMISQIEHNQVNPSINSLKLIAIALEAPLYTFLKNDDDIKEIVVRKDSRKFIGWANEETTYELLTPDTKGSIEFCLMTIPATNDSGSLLQSHQGEEVCYVIVGKVSIVIDNITYDLEEGDSLRIPKATTHKWINSSNAPVKVIFAINPPSF